MSKKHSIVFFGSGPVAAVALSLLRTHFSIEAVITKSQPPHHKGTFPVLNVVSTYHLPVLTANTKQELNELVTSTSFVSRVGVLVDYGIIVSRQVIDAFPLGIVNSHFSILPEWRGADPITFSILSGQATTGVSLMVLVEKMDEGPLLAQGEYLLSSDVTTPELTKRLIGLSDALLKQELPLYLSGEVSPKPQLESTILPDKTPSYSRKLTKADSILDFSKPAVDLEREVRAFIGWPGSRITLAGKESIVTKARVDSEIGIRKLAFGKAWATTTKEIAVQTAKGLFIIEKLKPAGKREMTAQEFLVGNKL